MSSLKKKLSVRGSNIVLTAKKNLEKARKIRGKEIPDYGRWLPWAKELSKHIGGLNNPTKVRQFAQSKIPFNHRVIANKDLLSLWYSMLIFSFPPWKSEIVKFSDNPNSPPKSMIKMDGLDDKLVSNIFIWHLYTVLSCLSHIDKIHSCIEIGGGSGEIARLWLANQISRIDRYAIVDIPECLFFADVCLNEEFPGQVAYFDGVNDPGTRVLLIPIDLLDKYKTGSDLVISVGSMQEMSDNWVSHYMQWLDRYDCRYFYSLNYMGSPIDLMGESRTLWAPRPSPNFAVKMQNPEPPIVWSMCPNRAFAETLYKKEISRSSFRDWSVFRGVEVNRQSYLEGLELIRQDPREGYIGQFLNIMLNPVDYHHQNLSVPKELLFLANLVKNQSLMDKLNPVVGGFES